MSAQNPLKVGLSYMYEPEFNRCILPLLESGDVDALEWSFDTVQDHNHLPDWIKSLLGAYSAAGNLYAHGVYYSLLAAGWGPRQEDWLRKWRELQEVYHFRHISEHFSFMTSGHAHQGFPLPLPFIADTVAIGRNRLAMLQTASNCMVGVENLALAFSANDVAMHGSLLNELVTPVGGFILLDLHNIYCQSVNFNKNILELVRHYPLHLVREIHVSGGSWARTSNGRRIRRDTHDNAIPEAILTVLPVVVEACPNLEIVVVERLVDTFRNVADEEEFRQEFIRIKKIVGEVPRHTVPQWTFAAAAARQHPMVNPNLLHQQHLVLEILSQSASAAQAKAKLKQQKALADFQPERWEIAMIETAMILAKKWGVDSTFL